MPDPRLEVPTNSADADLVWSLVRQGGPEAVAALARITQRAYDEGRSETQGAQALADWCPICVLPPELHVGQLCAATEDPGA